VLRLPLVIVNTACLLSSSLTMMLAVRALQRGTRLRHGLWLMATMLLALEFVGGTAWEWRNMIVHDGLLPSTNLFGSTFYTLVGFHGLHVTVGVIAMAIVLGLVIARRIDQRQSEGVEMVSWYWHLVDGVWVVIFSVVYLYGR
jgi:cytochrome c oxidase subunit 3/cytochrome o ubiquinol oxidase subunit 3